MDRIVVETNDFTADKWRRADQDMKSRLSQVIEQILEKAFQQKKGDIGIFMDKLSDEAYKNGLTEEKLNELLSE